MATLYRIDGSKFASEIYWDIGQAPRKNSWPHVLEQLHPVVGPALMTEPGEIK